VKRALQGQSHGGIGQERELLLGQRRTKHVANEAFATWLVRCASDRQLPTLESCCCRHRQGRSLCRMRNLGDGTSNACWVNMLISGDLDIRSYFKVGAVLGALLSVVSCGGSTDEGGGASDAGLSSRSDLAQGHDMGSADTQSCVAGPRPESCT